MTRRRSAVLLAIATVPAAAGTAFASPWSQATGHGQAVVKLSSYRTATAFDRNGDRRPLGGTFVRYDLNPYVEYGLTPRTTAFANLTLSTLASDFGGSTDRSFGLGDQEFGLRYRLSDTNSGQSVITAQGFVKLPAYNPRTSPAPGNNQVDVEGRLLFGHSMGLGPMNLWLVAAPGYHWRADSPANEWRADLTIGVKPPSDRWMVALESLWLRSVGPIGDSLGAGGNPGASESFMRWRKQLSAAYFIRPSWGVTAGVYRDFAGANVARGHGAFAGVWIRF